MGNFNDNKPLIKHEKIGDIIFPVTYGPNGIVLVDYPNMLFCDYVKRKVLKSKDDNSTSSID